MKHISITNDIKHTRSPNAVNERGRKLCPITFTILTCNNSIQIDDVLYSTKGFAEWVSTELEREYNYFLEITETFGNNVHILQYIKIRSPMTNLPYDTYNIMNIYNIFIFQYNKLPIDCVYDFIMKYKQIHSNT